VGHNGVHNGTDQRWDLGTWEIHGKSMGNPNSEAKASAIFDKADREGRFFELRRIDMNDHNWTCDAKRQVEVFLGVASSP